MKLTGWRGRLAAVIDSHRVPFAWGEHDCAIFMADAVKAQTGVDPLDRHRGRYKSARGAVRRFGRSIDAWLGERFEAVPPSRAQVGDLALVSTGDAVWPLAGAVVTGEMLTVFSEAGLGTMPLSSATMAFRVA